MKVKPELNIYVDGSLRANVFLDSRSIAIHVTLPFKSRGAAIRAAEGWIKLLQQAKPTVVDDQGDPT